MACRVIRDSEGRVGMIACGRFGEKRGICWECLGYSVALCDGPGAKEGTTCDRKLCYKHAVHVTGKNLDYCRMHGPKGGT
jgi:hypothetical protein